MNTSNENRDEARGGDPQDADFGRQAKEKEERLDESLARGDDSPAEPQEERPRAGGKAEPAQD